MESNSLAGNNPDSEKRSNDELKNVLRHLEDRNHLKDMFISNISHELRTPLNGILGFSELLEFDLQEIQNDKLSEYARYINHSANRLLRLLNNIIDFYQLESNELTIVNENITVNTIVSAVLSEMKELVDQQQVTVDLFVDDDLKINGDSKFFRRVITNLLHNAIKFSKNGKVRIEACYSNNSNQVVIKIIDNGIGIDRAHLKRIFIPFNQESSGMTRTYQGAGMSLPLAKKVVELMKGHFEINYAKGKGTTVTISMGSANPVKENSQKAVLHSEPFRERILVVEDDILNCELLKEYLRDYQYVSFAHNVKEALDIIAQARSENLDFAIVIMDINLSSDINGIDLAAGIRKRWPMYTEKSFIAQTGYTFTQDKSYLLNNGFDAFIAKPIKKHDILNLLQDLLIKSNAEQRKSDLSSSA